MIHALLLWLTPARHAAKAARDRDMVAGRMTASQLAEVRERVRVWKPITRRALAGAANHRDGAWVDTRRLNAGVIGS